MSGATTEQVLTAVRTALAALPVTRDPTKLFQEHVTAQPFRSLSHEVETFHLEIAEGRGGDSFGREDEREQIILVNILLGHPPFAVDHEREVYVAADAEAVVDLLETGPAVVWPAGFQVAMEQRRSTDRSSANWWVTTIAMSLRYVGSRRSGT